jgi:SsrA-binding protein
MLKTINILNKRARFDYEIIEKFTAGIVLAGTEIKSIRLERQILPKVFEFSNDELLPSIRTSRNTLLVIQSQASMSERKLLLNKRELKV